jgi:glyoxylase-like metal-dependent hydrolase (beta-lactamase superfamily II)
MTEGRSRPAVTRIRLPSVNVYLLDGDRPLLIDSGTRASGGKLRSELARHHVRPVDLGGILLTHGHADHAGGAGSLRVGPVPIMVGAADAAILSAGHNPPLQPTTASARLYRPFLDRSFQPYTADILLEGVTALSPYGIDGQVIPAAGHTPGSVAVLVGADLFIGDLARGGHLGGLVQPATLLPHYYSPDARHDLRLLRALILEHRPDTLHPGHGGPIPAARALSRLTALLDRAGQ